MIALVAAGGRTALIPASIDPDAVHAALAESTDAARELLAAADWFVIVDGTLVLRHGEAPVSVVDGVTTGDTLLDIGSGDDAPAPDAPEPAPGANLRAKPEPGDHDGATISLAELRARRAQAGAERAGDHDGDTVPTGRSAAAPTPRIRLSTGEVIDIDRTIIIGRSPRAARVSLNDAPRLVTVPSPQLDISRSHLEVRGEPGAVTVVDLRTTNGTTLRRADADPVRLRTNEPTVVVSGDVLDLGDGVTVTFEDL